jgi:tetratricopeptide (TPR) repeat protein
MFCLLYKVQGLVVFTLPVLLVLNLGVGEAVGYLERRRALPAWAPGAALLAVVALFGWHGYRQQDQSANQTHPAFAADLLDSLPYGSQVLAAGDLKTYALLWKQIAEQRRTDVSVFADNGEIFQGYQSFDAAKPEYFSVDEPSRSLAAGREIRTHGMLRYVGPSQDRPLPDPWQLSRPVPTLEDVRGFGSQDLSALEIGINMEVAQWRRAVAEGRPEEARHFLELSLADGEKMIRSVIPRREEIYFAFRQALSLERWSVAVRWGQELLARGEADGGTLNNLAWALVQSGGSLTQAEHLARRAVAIEPDKAIFLDTLVGILDRAGNRKEALQILSEACRRNPADTNIRALALEMFPEEF